MKRIAFLGLVAAAILAAYVGIRWYGLQGTQTSEVRRPIASMEPEEAPVAPNVEESVAPPIARDQLAKPSIPDLPPGEPIGHVDKAAGEVLAIYKDDGSPPGDDAPPAQPIRRILGTRSPVFASEVLLTGSQGRVKVVFKDNSTLSMTENSKISLSEYAYDPQDRDGMKMLFNMGQGAFRMLTGEIAKKNPERFNYTSPLGTIGVRGTEIASVVELENESHVLLEGGPFVQTSKTTGQAVEVAQPETGVAATPKSVAKVAAVPEKVAETLPEFEKIAALEDQPEPEPSVYLKEIPCRVLHVALQGHYIGDCADGLAHGYGTARGEDTYSGQFQEGLMHGRGQYSWANGQVYEGEFARGLPHGQGRLRFSDGRVYEGTFKRGKRTGQGTLYMPGGNVFTGPFAEGRLNGEGTLKFADGKVYEGDFDDGVIQGQGTLTFPNGNVYKGDFAGGNMHGEGTYRWASGDVFVGSFRDGRLHGQGTLHWANGDVYRQVYDHGELVKQELLRD
jgi:hypothetical protein